MCSFGYIPDVRLNSADVSESSVGSDRGFRNVGRVQTDIGDIPKRTHTIFKTRRKPEIKIVYLDTHIIDPFWYLVNLSDCFFILLLLFISNQIEGIQSIYNLICCLVIVSWKGDHPTMSPQSRRSEVQSLSLQLLIGCVSVSNSGLGRNSNLLRCLLILSLMTSLT